MKRIAVITATRAEYGILKPLIMAMKAEKSFETDVIVTGAHLMKDYGMTVKLIEEDGVDITARIDIPIDTTSSMGISHCMAVTLDKFAKYFANQDTRPDMIIVLGDRYELPAICIAAMNERIPIAHIAGGEATEGAVDEANRHMVTKMSYLHFTVADEYRKRVIQLGEDPSRVFNVGSLMIESILGLKTISKEEIEEFLGFSLNRKYALMTFHPVTLEDLTAEEQADAVIEAMTRFEDIDFICTKANADLGGGIINDKLEVAADKYANIHLFASLGQIRYLSLMKNACMVLGNTSSGIGEAPIFMTPTVNVGDRQKGRIRAVSIIDCSANVDSIVFAMIKALSEDFIASLSGMVNPYGDGHASEHIVNILKNELNKDIDLKKKFYDISFDV